MGSLAGSTCVWRDHFYDMWTENFLQKLQAVSAPHIIFVSVNVTVILAILIVLLLAPDDVLLLIWNILLLRLILFFAVPFGAAVLISLTLGAIAYSVLFSWARQA